MCINVEALAQADITQDELKQLLHYDSETGQFTWLATLTQNKRAGKRAGSWMNGYLRIKINGRIYRAHRLAWLYMYGEFPERNIKHLHTRSNNAINNLVTEIVCLT
jgi:hypothetical protein